MSDSGLELPPRDQTGPTDAERARVIETLRAAGARIGLEEAERRMDRALAARSRADLGLLVWDLPEGAPVPAGRSRRRRPGVWRSAAFRAHATAYGLVNTMLVGIWGLTDAHDLFWPFFPIAGWGVGLGMHAVACQSVHHRRDRAAAPVGPASRSEGAQRARLAVMFTDVVDSTRLTMVIGDEDWIRVRARYRALLQDCYAVGRGREVGTSGDGFLARFDRPSDAVACAIEIQSRIRRQREEFGFAPAVRIGINAGEAIEEDGDVLGTVVNLASRVTAAADPHEILVTEAVADALDDRFRLADGGLREMKGLDRTAHVLRVVWE